MQVQGKNIFLTDSEWKTAISSPISKETMRVICLAVVNNGGAVMVLMSDDSSIAKRMDTSAEVNTFIDTGH